MIIGEYELVNDEKVERALNGFINGENKRVGGIAKPDGSYDESELLAEYDKLGGLIKKGTDKIKTGSFYDLKNKRPHKEPKVTFIYRINGKVIEVPDGTELPGIVKAQRILEEDTQETKRTKNKKK